MSGRYGDVDYHRLTKTSVGFGVSLFVVAALGTFAGDAMFGEMTGLGETLLTNAELLGVAIAFTAPFVFGILLPLTE
ncbi:hypothetical protein SAMN04487950_3147 [Halogranum rubrum]|uniref:Uncharacterized protein n=2 Tax=Halogranum rubrum TaxID=553466 RepID=A0A1I4GAQ2_9EURY|nr:MULTISPECIES: hypothetical protein [Halogranum]EJN59682.1 hypothetical protein HSB1_18400 [Halogranum salarium B-1]SFL26949.1 hypothetical protein SAMN04487950_3147 [Halogranum rubrum]